MPFLILGEREKKKKKRFHRFHLSVTMSWKSEKEIVFNTRDVFVFLPAIISVTAIRIYLSFTGTQEAEHRVKQE